MGRLPLALIVASFAGALHAQSSHSSAAKPTIVLVHGAFADGSSWQKVIPILQRDGYTVIAVQNPLTSLAADVETTKRVIDGQTGPVAFAFDEPAFLDVQVERVGKDVDGVEADFLGHANAVAGVAAGLGPGGIDQSQLHGLFSFGKSSAAA